MACNPDILRQVPLFALLDDEETAVLAGQVEVKTFAPRQRIYKIGDPGERAYVLVSGSVRVTTLTEAPRKSSWTSHHKESFSASRPCSSRRPTKLLRSRRKKPCAWKW